MPNGTAMGGGGGGGERLKSPSAGKVHHNKENKNKLTITTSMTFQQSDGEEEEVGLGEGLVNSDQSGTLKKQKVYVAAVQYYCPITHTLGLVISNSSLES